MPLHSKGKTTMQKCEIEIGINQKELNTHGTSNFPLAIYNDDLQRNFIPWHWHEELELIIVIENKLNVRIGPDKYIIKAGNGILINAETLHFISDIEGQPGQLKSIVFHPRLIGGNSDSIFWQKYLSPILKDPSLTHILLDNEIDWQKEIINKILISHKMCEEKKDGYEFLVRDELSSIQFNIYKNRTSRTKTPSQKSLRDEKRSKAMLNYISNHFSSTITVEMIASNSNISESEVLRCFKNTTGTTPMQYVINYRLQRASELLVSTSMKVIDIALDCGFGETSYFTKKFKSKYSITPTVYRENYKENF
jgi:AraC-like DNA-binding protein